MIYHNDRVIKDQNIQMMKLIEKKEFKYIAEYIQSLEDRLSLLEAKKVGRPRKEV